MGAAEDSRREEAGAGPLPAGVPPHLENRRRGAVTTTAANTHTEPTLLGTVLDTSTRIGSFNPHCEPLRCPCLSHRQ